MSWSCAGFRDQSHHLLTFATNWSAYSGEIPLRLKKKDRKSFTEMASVVTVGLDSWLSELGLLRWKNSHKSLLSCLRRLRSGPQPYRRRRVLYPFDVKTLGLVETISQCVQHLIKETEKNHHFQAVKLTNHSYFNVKILQHSFKWVIIKVENMVLLL